MTVATAPRPTRTSKTKPAISRDRYHRYTYEGVVYPGWTSIGKIVDKSEALITWATRKAVAGVLEQVDALPTMLAKNKPQDVVEMLAKRSAWDRDRAGTRGTSIHDHADRIVRGLDPVDVLPEHVKPVEGIGEWWARSGWRLRLSEAYIVNTTLGYGGGPDLLAYDENGLTVMADYKTGKTYPEHRLQLLAYASAEYIAPQGSLVAYPMPRVDRHVILLVTEDGVEPIEIDIDDEDRAAFLACIPLARWKKSKDTWKGRAA